MPETEQYLELSGIAPERQKARITWPGNEEGTIYEILDPVELGPLDAQRFARKWDEIRELERGEKLMTKAQEKRVLTLVDQLARTIIPDAPKAAIEALPSRTKRNLVVAFLGEEGEALYAMMMAFGFPQAPSPPDSSASTEATQNGGSSSP